MALSFWPSGSPYRLVSLIRKRLPRSVCYANPTDARLSILYMSETPLTPYPKASRKKAVAALLLSGLVALFFAEVVVRLILPHPSFYVGHPGNVPGLVIKHDTRGHTWNPGFHGQMTTSDFSNRYIISEQGLRDDLVVGIGEFRVLAVGDSFTGGEGVEASETWPKQLQEILNSRVGAEKNVRVINAGVTGYSIRQMRQMAEEMVPLFRPDLVIIGVYPDGVDRIENPFVIFGDHLVRSDAVNNMRHVNGGYIWYYSDFRNATAASIDIWCQRHFHFAAHLIKLFNQLRDSGDEPTVARQVNLPSADTRLRALLDELAQLNSFLSTEHTRFAVLVVSRQAADGSFSENSRSMAQAVQIYCDKLGISVVDPLTEFESVSGGQPLLRFQNDAHWTPTAHRVAAAQIGVQLTIVPEKSSDPRKEARLHN